MRRFLLCLVVIVLLVPACSRTPAQPPASLPDDQTALHTVVDFFEYLHAGRYDEASRLYGGTYETMIAHNPSVDPNDHGSLLRNACTVNGAQCLRVKAAAFNRGASGTKFTFKVQFQTDDGALFVLGPCCGASATEQPSTSTFEIGVVKTPEGQFLVMDMPPYTP
jgi:hypothetical protein